MVECLGGGGDRNGQSGDGRGRGEVGVVVVIFVLKCRWRGIGREPLFWAALNASLMPGGFAGKSRVLEHE